MEGVHDGDAGSSEWRCEVHEGGMPGKAWPEESGIDDKWTTMCYSSLTKTADGFWGKQRVASLTGFTN